MSTNALVLVSVVCALVLVCLVFAAHGRVKATVEQSQDASFLPSSVLAAAFSPSIIRQTSAPHGLWRPVTGRGRSSPDVPVANLVHHAGAHLNGNELGSALMPGYAQLLRSLTGKAPAQIDLEAFAVVEHWGKRAELALGALAEIPTDQRTEESSHEEKFLIIKNKRFKHMRGQLGGWHLPHLHHVFALASGSTVAQVMGSRLEEIHAIAMVESHSMHPFGKLVDLALDKGIPYDFEKRITAVVVTGIVVTPEHQQRGVGRELLYDIIEWAADKKQLVTLFADNAKLQEYYESLGFELIDPEDDHAMGRTMVYCGPAIEELRLRDPLGNFVELSVRKTIDA